MERSKKDIIRELKQNILKMQGFRTLQAAGISFQGLAGIEAAFPNSIFPTGTLHEFLSPEPEQHAATGGFIAGLLQTLMHKGGICIWAARNRMIFPPALKAFGIEPDRIIFVDVEREKDLLWVVEEGLKCEGLAAVVGEVSEMNFAESRRMQLLTEKSGVTGFLLLRGDKQVTTASIARWRITHLPSEPESKLPGVGFPRWRVELLKVRNGVTGLWDIEWSAKNFRAIEQPAEADLELIQLQTG